MKPIAYMENPLPELLKKDWKKELTSIIVWLSVYLLDFNKKTRS